MTCDFLVFKPPPWDTGGTARSEEFPNVDIDVEGNEDIVVDENTDLENLYEELSSELFVGMVVTKLRKIPSSLVE